MGSSGGEDPTESPHRWLRGAAGGSADRVGGALIEDGVAYLRDPSGACAAILNIIQSRVILFGVVEGRRGQSPGTQ